MQPKKVYISGPMRGYENNNIDAFNEAEEKLVKAGFSVFNPAWLKFDSAWSPEDFMPIDAVILSRCDYIYQLDNWEKSSGGSTEWMNALWSGKKVINHSWLDWYISELERRKQNGQKEEEEYESTHKET